ncbi:MAG: AbrB/MazE/SpoVT family DNA-binding domain-containing protein [Mesorhizobium sp.]|nr:AbrB/MazE/SpoVT family DNA-binding domain-containing protein [Mesorhizobium sp.]
MRARAKVFTTGGSQAVRLPKQFRLDSAEVEIWRDGRDLRLRPIVPHDSWKKTFAKIDELLAGEFPDREQPSGFDRDVSLTEDGDPGGSGSDKPR